MEFEVEMKHPNNGDNRHTSTNSPPRMNYLAVCLFVFLHLVCSGSEILPGSALYASNPNQTWSSPNGTFSVRFIPASSSAYSLAIVYSSSAPHIPIWIAGGHNSLSDAGASFLFSPDGDLRLSNGSGAVLWRSETSGRGVSRAFLDETGNFVLLNKTSLSVWTSFEHPVDTLVPSQNLTPSMLLTSRSYSFKLNPDGNSNLKWNNTIVYWNLGGFNSSVSVNLSAPSLQFQTTGILALNDPTLSSPLNMAYSSDFSELDSFRFLRLDTDGNLRMYSLLTDEAPVVRWTGVTDQCLVYGFCGNMGICSYNDKGPICGCPSLNFDPVDPNDSRMGCKRKVELQSCPGNGNATLLEMDHAMFLTYPPETNTDMYILDISACRFNCLESGLCAASTISATDIGHCYIKTSSFVSGYRSPSIPSTSFVKVCGPALPNPPLESGDSGLWRLHSWAVSLSALLSLALLLVLVLAILWLCYCRDGPGVSTTQYSLLEYASGAPVQFQYKELERATKRFREKLGEGGFGAVYKGVLVNKMTVAVKRLDLEGIEQGEKQFRMEVGTISSTHHLNLVRLIGFCSQGRHRMVVYEFMKNRSLDRCLFESHDEMVLNWETRYRIALGAARGITYLHEECRDCIVHCDIKPENILLDENYNAKVSDFGLAKLLTQREHRHRSVRGTRGYLAPEWLSNLPITSKSDVYSYGMVLLEIITGRRNFEVSQETNGIKLSVWAYQEFEKGNGMGILDKRLIKEDEQEELIEREQVRRAIQISFWCIQESPNDRPMMGKVVQMLQGIVGIQRPPTPYPKPSSTASGMRLEGPTSTCALVQQGY